MKKGCSILLGVCCYLVFFCTACVSGQNKNLKLVFIRHAEKSVDGDNLNCQGLNRSMLLPPLLYKKFGIPVNIYVPSLKQGDVTKHARMLQTILPFMVKYNLSANTDFDEEDYKGISNALIREKGTVIIVWEHKNIPPILNYLGLGAYHLRWPENDFSSILIVTFSKGKAILQKDTEGLKPAAGCPF
jgi:hypothetical protein